MKSKPSVMLSELTHDQQLDIRDTFKEFLVDNKTYRKFCSRIDKSFNEWFKEYVELKGNFGKPYFSYGRVDGLILAAFSWTLTEDFEEFTYWETLHYKWCEIMSTYIFRYYPKMKGNKCFEVCYKFKDRRRIGSYRCRSKCKHNINSDKHTWIRCDCIEQATRGRSNQ